MTTTTEPPTPTTRKFLAVLPGFPGFYESILAGFIDNEIECAMEPQDQYDDAGKYIGQGPARTYEEIEPELNYPAARLAMSEAWVKRFCYETGLLEEGTVEAELFAKPAITLESISSPREYNFSTDRLFVEFGPETLERLKPLRESEEFAQVLEDSFTSRSGFIPFYSSDPDDEQWRRPVEDWDHNELGCLLSAHVERELGTHEPDPRNPGRQRRVSGEAKLLDEIVQHHSISEAASEIWNTKTK